MHNKVTLCHLNSNCFELLFAVLLSLILAGCKGEKVSPEREAEAQKLMDEEFELYQRGEYDSAMVCLDMADSLSGANDTVRAYTCAERSTILASTGRMAEAVPFAKQSVEFSKRIGDYETMMNMYSSLGIMFRRLGMNDSALIYYKKGVDIADKVEDKAYVSNLMNSIAVLYTQQDRMGEALAYASKAEHWARTTKDTMELYNALGTRASVLMRQGNYKQSKDLMEPYFGAILATGQAPYILKCATPLLTSYLRLGMMDKAEHLISATKPYVDKMGTAGIGGMGILEGEAKLYNERKEYAKELAVLNRLDTLNQQNHTTQPQELLFQKAECYRNLGDNGKALMLMKRAYEVSDSLKNSGVDKQLSEFSVRYKTQEKELELSVVRQEKAEQQAHLFAAIAALAVVCAAFVTLLVYYFYRRRTAKQERELESHRRFIEGMEDERARLARELHDGTCNDLLELSMKMNAESDANLASVRQIRDNVRRISHELMPPRFADVDICCVLDDYLGSYPLDGCTINFTAQDGYNWASVPSQVAYEVYRVVQEAIGNTVKHAQPTHISVSLGVDGGTLRLRICNDGVASATEKAADGIGSRTMLDRVSSVGGKLRVSVESGEYIIEMSVPLKNE